MSKVYDFTKEEDKKAACEEYARCKQNELSSSAESRMDELYEQAQAVGLTFFMTNEDVYNMPSALVKPRYELVNLEQYLAGNVDSSVTKLTVKVRSGMSADGFEATVTNGDDVLFEKRYDYGYNCSWNKDSADERTPYVSDVLQSLIDEYQAGEFSVEAGRNVFAGKDVRPEKVEEFKNDYCTDLKLSGVKEFVPHEIYVTKDTDLPASMQSHVDAGGSLYMLDEPTPGSNVFIGTSIDKSGIMTYVPMHHIRQEITITDNALSYLPDTMREHVEAGGKLYMCGQPKAGSSAMVSMDKADNDGIWTTVELSDITYAYENEDQDFADAVAAISENEEALFQ